MTIDEYLREIRAVLRVLYGPGVTLRVDVSNAGQFCVWPSNRHDWVATDRLPFRTTFVDAVAQLREELLARLETVVDRGTTLLQDCRRP